MKILMIIDALSRGGKERRLLELLEYFSRIENINYQLVVLSSRIEYDLKAQNISGVQILERKSKKDLTIFKRLYRICKQFQPDIIQSWESMASVYAIPVAKYLGLSFVNASISHAPDKISIFSKRWIRAKLTFPFSDAVVANSIAGLKAYNASPSNSYCIHNGFNFERLQKLEGPQAIRAKFSLNTPYIVGMVAAFTDKKDYHTFITAALSILDQRNDVSFICVGAGYNLEECKSLVPGKFQDRLIFTGKQSQVESIMNVFDIGVLTTYTEGISNVIMEYMALKKPVIATSGGGTPELVLDGQTGFLIGVKEVNRLIDKIQVLLNNPKMRQSMGEAGNKRILETFSLEKMSDSFVDLYKKLCTTKS